MEEAGAAGCKIHCRMYSQCRPSGKAPSRESGCTQERGAASFSQATKAELLLTSGPRRRPPRISVAVGGPRPM